MTQQGLHKSANDDELDQLIRETQNIWKSLANSGIDLQDDPNTINFDSKISIPKKLESSSCMFFIIITVSCSLFILFFF